MSYNRTRSATKVNKGSSVPKQKRPADDAADPLVPPPPSKRRTKKRTEVTVVEDSPVTQNAIPVEVHQPAIPVTLPRPSLSENQPYPNQFPTERVYIPSPPSSVQALHPPPNLTSYIRPRSVYRPPGPLPSTYLDSRTERQDHGLTNEPVYSQGRPTVNTPVNRQDHPVSNVQTVHMESPVHPPIRSQGLPRSVPVHPMSASYQLSPGPHPSRFSPLVHAGSNYTSPRVLHSPIVGEWVDIQGLSRQDGCQSGPPPYHSGPALPDPRSNIHPVHPIPRQEAQDPTRLPASHPAHPVVPIQPSPAQPATLLQASEKALPDVTGDPSDDEASAASSCEDEGQDLSGSERSDVKDPEITFSKAPTDVLQRHWEANGRPLPPATGGSLLVPSGFVPPRARRDYPVRYQWLIDIARDYLLGQVLLEFGFPLQDELRSQAGECFNEAVSYFPERYPDSPLDREYLESNKDEMITLLMKLVCASRGSLRDAIRKLVSAELDQVVESQPPTEYTNHSTGEVRSIKDERKTIIRNHVDGLFRGYRYLDSPRKLSGRDTKNALNSPVLRNAIIHLYNTRVFQKALKASPDIDTVKKYPTRPLDPDYWMHWSEGCPPLLVTFVGTILCVCYSEWRSGEFTKIKLTTDDHCKLFKDIRYYIDCDWENATYQDAIRARFRQWAQQSKMILA